MNGTLLAVTTFHLKAKSDMVGSHIVALQWNLRYNCTSICSFVFTRYGTIRFCLGRDRCGFASAFCSRVVRERFRQMLISKSVNQLTSESVNEQVNQTARSHAQAHKTNSACIHRFCTYMHTVLHVGMRPVPVCGRFMQSCLREVLQTVR